MYIVLWKGKSDKDWQGREAFTETYADAETIIRAERIKGRKFDYAIVEAHPTVYESPEEVEARLGIFA